MYELIILVFIPSQFHKYTYKNSNKHVYLWNIKSGKII